MSESDPVIIHTVGYTDDADVEYEDGRIVNHDELLREGKTFDEIRAVDPETAELMGDVEVTPNDSLWRERYEEWEIGDCERIME